MSEVPSVQSTQPAGALRGLRIRQPRAEDGAALWQLVRSCGVLSVNSSYAYVLMADFFGPTCALAEHNGRPAGAVIGLRRPDRPQALFVWQIGVHPQARGTGLAQRMLDAILARPSNADLRELHATVAPSNGASERMFRRFAARHGAEVELAGGYPAELFPDSREAERTFRIRPLKPGTRPEENPC